MKYTRKQIQEAISFWKQRLNDMILEESNMSRQQLDDFYSKLQNGTVEFDYTKKDGSRRHAKGTLNSNLMPSEQEQRRIYMNATNPDGSRVDFNQLKQRLEQRKDYMPYYWDLEKNGYRQFHVSRFNGITSSEPYVDDNDDYQGEKFGSSRAQHEYEVKFNYWIKEEKTIRIKADTEQEANEKFQEYADQKQDDSYGSESGFEMVSIEQVH